MTFTHGFAFQRDQINIVDDSVHNGVGHGAVFTRRRIQPDIPVVGLILGAEDRCSMLGSGFHEFQQIIDFLGRKRLQEPVVQNQQIRFGERLYRFSAEQSKVLWERSRHSRQESMCSRHPG